MSITLEYSGKNILVIGGTSGINLGVAQAFARHGAKVAVASRSQEKVDAAVASLTGLGARDTLRLEAGMNLYKLADLSSLWVHADVYESDLPWVRKDQPAQPARTVSQWGRPSSPRPRSF